MATLRQYWLSVDTELNIGSYAATQTFVADDSYTITELQLRLARGYSGSDTGAFDLSIDLYDVDGSHNPNNLLAHFGDLSSDSMGTVLTMWPFNDTTYAITDGVEYAIVVSISNITGNRYCRWGGKSGYAYGYGKIQYTEGVWSGAGLDWHFAVYGTGGDPPPAPEKAITPAPANATTDVTLDQETITWVDGGGATSYNVYYGDTSGGLTRVSTGQAGLSFTVAGVTLGSPYEYITTRYWRIDSINVFGTTTGDEWSFTTIRFKPPSVTYWYSTFYYRLLVDEDGNLGDPPPTGVEDVDYEIVTLAPNLMCTPSRLVAAARNTIYYEDV